MPPKPDSGQRTLDDDGMKKIIENVDAGGGRSLADNASGATGAVDDAGDDGQGQANVADPADTRTSLRDRLQAAQDPADAGDGDGDVDDGGDAGEGDTGQTPPSLRQSLAADFGLEGFDRYESDEDAVRALADEYVRLSDHMAHLQTPAADADAQVDAGKVTTDEKPTFWEAPQFDEGWMQQVEFDPEIGAYRHKIGRGTPDIAAKVNAYHGYMQGEQQKFWRQGPHEYMRPFVEHIAREVAETAGTEAFSARDEHEQAVGFFRENMDWLFVHDKDGQAVRDPRTGKLRPTPEGQDFQKLIPALEAEGVPMHLQSSIAKIMIERDRYAAQQQTGGGTSTSGDDGTSGDTAGTQDRATRDKNILRNAARRSTGRGGTVRRSSNRAPAGKKAPSQNASLNLRQRLREDIQQKHGLKGEDNAVLR